LEYVYFFLFNEVTDKQNIKRKKNILSSKLADTVNVSVPRQNIQPEKQSNTNKLIQRGPEQEVNQVDFSSRSFVLHLHSSFTDNIHNGRGYLEMSQEKS